MKQTARLEVPVASKMKLFGHPLQEVKTQLEIFSKIASLGAASSLAPGGATVDEGTKQIYALSKSVAATKAAVDRDGKIAYFPLKILHFL